MERWVEGFESNPDIRAVVGKAPGDAIVVTMMRAVRRAG